ncbi:phage tail spike protein [Bacillus cereus group sp. RP43]|uniref:phage tail spike protein n=1 Tax=Bacillus cereus group sp. RP43 TaxID=3040260 RepID=UPI0033912E30
MRTPSGELHVVDFKTEQIVASIQPKDYWDDKRHWEIKNNIDTLEFRVFDNTKHSTTLMQQNLVLKEVRDGRIVPYVITEIEKESDDRSVVAYASGEWVQLAKAGIIPPQKLEGKTVIEMVDIALAGTKWKKGNLEYASFRSMTIDEFIDPLTLLKKIASLFELEIQYRAEVVGSQVVGRYVDMIKKRGRETGKEVTLGKDLMGIKRIENSQNICTALLGFVKKEGGEFVTITEINNGVPYLVDSDAFQRWSEKGQHKFGFYSPETEDQDMNPKRLMTLMNTELKKRVNTSVSYEVQAQSIGRVFGLAHELINEGDTIRIKDTGFTPKLYLEARVIAGDESFTDPTQDKYVFGDYHEIIDPNEELRKIYNRILSSLGNKQEMLDQLDRLVKEANETASNAKKESEAAKALAEKVQENIKNNTVEIIESKNPPTTGLKDRKTLWLDISNGKPGILKLWKDGIWDPVVPDVESVKKETLEQVNKEIESTKTELNQKVQTVENKAKEISGQIVDVQKQVNDKVDQTWINNQLKDKADKSGVYTKDEIKDGFIGKQIYETDKQGNVKKFQDINTSIGQTNEALTQKAEKSELKKTNDGLSQLEKKTNEVVQTAEGTKQTLTDLKTKVDNTVIGGRNLLLETATKSHSVKTGENKPHTYFDVAKDASTLMQGKNLAMSFLFTGKVTAWGTTNKWAGFEVKITFTDNTFHYPSCRIENRLTLGKQYNQERFTAAAVVMDKPIKEITVYALGRDFTGEMLIEKPKLEIGTVSTAWSPAPEDQVTTTDFTKKTVEIETTIKGINTSVSNVQNEQGKLTERMTKSEQTADGFKKSIETLTKKDSDISNKLNTVESTVEGTKKTISDIQSDTTSLKQTTTEIKEQAGKVTEKLSSVEKKFDDMKIGGRNLIPNSKINETSSNYGFGIRTTTIDLVADETYTLVGNGRVDQKTIDDGKSLLIYIYEPTWKYKNINFSIKTTTDSTGSIQFTPNWSGKYIVASYLYPNGGSRAGKATTNWVALYKGNKSMDWMPAPEDQVTTDEFAKKTTDIEKSVDGVKTTVTNVQNSQVGFEKRMTSVEQTASGLSSTVGTLNNVVSDQGKKLTEANTKIEQQATAIGAKVEIKQVEDYVAGFKIPDLKNTVNKNKEDLLGELANKLATERFNQKMTLIDNRFSVNEKGIDLAAKKTEVYTQTQSNDKFATNAYVRDMEGRIQVTEKNILSTVKQGEIISSINQTAETIKIKAGKIELDGTTIAKYLEAQELRGTTIRTDNGVNYVHIQKQFIRLMESNLSRVYLGYYKDRTSQVQPTVVLGGDSDFQDGSVVLSKQPTQGFLGVINGKDSNGEPYFVSSVIFKRSGDLNLNAGMNGNVTVNSGKGIGHYAKGGSFWAEATDGVTLKGGAKSVWMDCQSSIVFNLKGKNMLDIVATPNAETDLRFQTVILRNGNVDGYKTLQVKNGTGNAYNAVTASAFQTASKREYKTNIRDIQFNAIEKIMALSIQQYNLKTDIEDLYEKRMNRAEGDPILTTNDIETHYGWIADDENTPGCFVTKARNAAEIYSSIAILIQAFQDEKRAKDAEIQELKEKNEQTECRIEALEEENQQMNHRVEVLEQLLVQNLIDRKPEQR